MALPEIIKDINDQVSAIDPNGDTMVGTLRIQKSTWPQFLLIETTVNRHAVNEIDTDGRYVISIRGESTFGGANGTYLFLDKETQPLNSIIRFGRNVDGVWEEYNLLHSGNYSEYALPLSGNVTMAGSIKWGNNRGIGPAASVTDLDIYAGRVSIRLEPANISGYDLKNCIFIRDTGTGQTYKFYGEHNKPTATDIGAISSSEMPLITVTKSITLTTEWQDTGIVFNNISGLETGTYAIQVSGITGGISGLWGDIFSGIMSWYNGNTNGADADEILLHSAGHARNGNYIFLRTLRHSGNTINVKLQIKATTGASAATNITFKFRRLI